MSRPGYRLLEVEPAALPVFLFRSEVLLIDRRPLGPLEEFVLKAIDAGFVTVKEISGVLGLLDQLVVDTLVNLQREDCVHQIVQGERYRELRLTAHGAKILESELKEMPSTDEIRIAFDRIAWSITPEVQGHLMKPKEMESSGRWELPPRVKKKPDAEELSLDEIERVVRTARPRSFGVTVLAVNRIIRAERFFLPVDVAIFESISGGDSQISVLIDGRQSDVHEEAIERLGGLEFVGARLASPASSASDVLASDYGDEAAAELALSAPTNEQRDEARRQRVQAQLAQGRDASPEELAPSRPPPSESYTTSAVEFIDTFEHREYLERALETSSRRLLIVSPWIAGNVVNSAFLHQIRMLLQRGVRVHIGYGLNQRPGDRPVSAADARAEDELKRMAERFDNFTLGRLGNTHSKQLLFDDVHVSGSFNWLSFQGSRHKEYRHEESTVVRIKKKVDAKYLDLCHRIEAAKASDDA